MQTFLPYPDIKASAKVLDRQRLGKQRIETKQILNILFGLTPKDRHRFHPAVLMWKGHESFLCDYGIAICKEWISRGYKDAQLPIFRTFKKAALISGSSKKPPQWFGHTVLHDSYKSNLTRKKPDHYRVFWPHIPDNWEYMWPTKGLKDSPIMRAEEQVMNRQQRSQT
jgi:hypothetical protein